MDEIVKNAKNSSELSARKGETLAAFRLEADFIGKNRSVRTVKLVQTEETEVKSKWLALISSLVQSNLITNSDLHSVLRKGKAGRKPISFNAET
ncbi:MAG: hypothetical protein ABWZ66_11255, partial [Pyrinomonadaceae bacterium]